MLVEVSKGPDKSSSPLPDTSPPEPQSFIEAAGLRYAVKEELATIIASSSFRTSAKSCEFLRYVVEVTLDGRTDSLKERSIGIDLLGRDSSYDPNTDATVRVRAVEVRKRLNSFYATQPSGSRYRIELLPGSYMPRFVPAPKQLLPLAPRSKSAEPVVAHTTVREQEFLVLPLNILKMACPALIALLLCALFLRQQIQRGDPYHQFWDKRLHGKSVMLLPIDKTRDVKANIEDRLQAILPIIWLAGRYDLKAVTEPLENKNDDGQKELESNAVIVHLAKVTSPELIADTRLRYSITHGPNELRLADQTNPAEVAPGDTALLTILPDHPSELWLTGTDWKAVNALAEIVTSTSQFPAQLNTDAEAGRAVQVSWRSAPSPHIEIDTH